MIDGLHRGGPPYEKETTSRSRCTRTLNQNGLWEIWIHPCSGSGQLIPCCILLPFANRWIHSKTTMWPYQARKKNKPFNSNWKMWPFSNRTRMASYAASHAMHCIPSSRQRRVPHLSWITKRMAGKECAFTRRLMGRHSTALSKRSRVGSYTFAKMGGIQRHYFPLFTSMEYGTMSQGKTSVKGLKWQQRCYTTQWWEVYPLIVLTHTLFEVGGQTPWPYQAIPTCRFKKWDGGRVQRLKSISGKNSHATRQACHQVWNVGSNLSLSPATHTMMSQPHAWRQTITSILCWPLPPPRKNKNIACLVFVFCSYTIRNDTTYI